MSEREIERCEPRVDGVEELGKAAAAMEELIMIKVVYLYLYPLKMS